MDAQISPPLREWIQYLIVNNCWWKPCEPRSFGATDWQSVEPIRGIYAEDYDVKSQYAISISNHAQAVALTLGAVAVKIVEAMTVSLGILTELVPTQEMPQLYGNWTTTFGSRSFHDECNIEGLDRSDFDWLNPAQWKSADV